MIKKCTRCKWANNEFANCVSYWGNPNADLVFVGEAFGASEAKKYKETGIPECFIGKAGDNLNIFLNFAGLKKDDVILMNAMRCYQPGNPTPTKSEMDQCFLYTFFDLQNINPKLVIALGASAFYQLTGKTELQPYLGRVLWSDKINQKVFATYHPAACIYDPNKRKLLKKHFKMLPEMIDAEPEEIKNYKFKYITTEEEFEKAYEDLDQYEYLMFDIETTGLNPYSDEDIPEGFNPYKEEFKTIQISGNDDLIYIIDVCVIYKIKDSLKKLFETKKMTGQGWDFDAKFIYIKLGIFIAKWDYDTCLAEYIISGMKDNDLTYLTYKYVPESYGYDDEIKKVGGAHKIKDHRKLLQYGANDVGVLFKIREKQEKDLMIGNYENLFYNIKMPVNKILTKMALRGVEYDLDLLRETDKRYDKRAGRLLLKIKELDGVKACEKKFKRVFNPRSYPMVKWLLINYYNLPVLKTTTGKDDGNPSIGQEEMKKYVELYNNEYCTIMQKYRSIQTIRSNFLSGVIPKLVDNVAHTTYSLHATTTGRPNSKNPNCFSRDTEVLTKDGWKYFSEISYDSKIAQYDYNSGSITFSNPNNIIKYLHKGDLLNIQTDKQIDMFLTKDHRCLIKNRKSEKFKFISAENYSKDAIQIQAGNYQGGVINENLNKLILLCAFQADGHRRGQDGIVEFTFSKKRKIDRLENALINYSIPFKKYIRSKNQVRFYISRRDVPNWFTKTFDLTYILSLDKSSLNFFSNEIFFWDGDYKRKTIYSTNNKINIDIVQIVQILSNKRAKIRKVITSKGNVNWQLDVIDRNYSMTTNHIKTYYNYNDFVYCVSMPKETVIVRRNGKVVITGNCLNIPRNKDIKKCIKARDGYKFVAGDESQLEVRIASVVYNEPILIDICNDVDKDMHCNITAKAFGREYTEIYDGYQNEVPEIVELRVQGKTIQFGVIYQMGSSKLAYKLGIPKEDAQKFIDDYYLGFPSLASNIELTKQEVIKSGFLRNYFGFVRRWRNHTEEDHNTLREGVNFLVQSLAWNLLELSLIEVDRKFSEQNLDAHLVLQVYDSIVAEVREDHVEKASKILKSTLENVIKPYENINRVMLKTDIKIGNTLAEV